MLAAFPSLALDTHARTDPYRFAHKAIRAMLGRLLATAGCTDFGDVRSVDALRAEAVDVVDVLHTHARIEVQYLDALLGAYAHGQANDVQREHAELEAELFAVLRDLDGERAADAADARERGHAIYLLLSRFVAHYFLHMADEETRILPLIHRHVDEIVLRRALVAAQASIRHEERARTYLLVLGAIAPYERDALKKGMCRLTAPPREPEPFAVIRSRGFESRPIDEPKARR